ncbi:hypothetical protein GQ457_10G002180 [Hibiscus cannabinus]
MMHQEQDCLRNTKRCSERRRPIPIFSLFARDDSNIFKWTVLIKGPSETPYEGGGVFQLAFAVPEQYTLCNPLKFGP